MRIVDPHRPPQPQRHEPDLLAVARDEVELAQTISSSRSKGGAGPSKMLTPPMCIGLLGPSMWRNDASCGLIHSIRSLLLQDSANTRYTSRLTDIPVWLESHLDVAGAGIQASPPGDDPIAARVDRHRAHLRAGAVPRSWRKIGAALPVGAPASRTCQVHRCHPDAPPTLNGAKHAPPDAQRGQRPASRASPACSQHPGYGPPARAPVPRLGSARSPPRGGRSAFSELPQPGLEAPDRSLAAIDVQPHPGRRGARAAATQPSAKQRQRVRRRP